MENSYASWVSKMSDALPTAQGSAAAAPIAGDADALQLSPTTISALYQDLPRADSMAAALRILEVVRQSVLGDGLLTVTGIMNTPAALAESGQVDLQRLWSSNPAEYPVAGRKRKTLTAWTRQLVQRGEVFVGEGDAALTTAFDDHARILGLGLHAVINVPLLAEGRCVALFNVLGTRSQWQSHEVEVARLLANLSKPWVLPEVAGMAQKVIVK